MQIYGLHIKLILCNFHGTNISAKMSLKRTVFHSSINIGKPILYLIPYPFILKQNVFIHTHCMLSKSAFHPT